MKTQNCHFTQVFLLLFCFLILGCSKENDDAPLVEPDPVYIVSDLDTTIIENPENGTVLGSLTTDLPGNLTYTSSNAAFDLDIASLEVFVADMSAFDYELNTRVTGTIVLSNGENTVTSSITINLTDLGDVIEGLLSSSMDAYLNAAQGDWVEITSDEFQNLENQLEEVALSGATLEEYMFSDNSTGASLGNGDSAGYTVANVTNATLAEGSYLYAIRFYVGTGIFGIAGGNKIKLSETSSSEGYTDIGNPLPEKTSTEREVFYVLKRNVNATTATAHLALYFAPKNGATFRDSSGASHFQVGDLTEFASDPVQNRTWAYQGLSTTKLQWE